MRSDVGGVDNTNFLSWAKWFVETVLPLTEGGRKVLRTYDAYCVHISLAVLELFNKNGIIAYAIPAYASGKTQPCDVVVFSKFKEEVNEALNNLLDVDTLLSFNMYDFSKVLRLAYRKSFVPANIVASFRRLGLWQSIPCDFYRPLCQHRRMNWVLYYRRNMAAYEMKRTKMKRTILGDDMKVLKNGFVDTSNGFVLTSSSALREARNKAK